MSDLLNDAHITENMLRLRQASTDLKEAFDEYATQTEKDLEQAQAALTKINVIRNSIIGLQSVNWSEHVYPLVEALEEAGIEGMGYGDARSKFGTMLERTNKAEAENRTLREALKYARRFLNAENHDLKYIDAALAGGQDEGE